MKLSIIIPTYNRPTFLMRALSSVPNHFKNELEVIVVDDGSCTDYSDVISKSSGTINKYIKVSHRKGVSHARNIGITNSVGDWVLFLDDDDEIVDGYVASLINCISEVDSSVGFAWGNVEIVVYKNDLIKVVEKRFRYSSPVELELQATTIGASFGFAVRRDILLRLGAFDTAFTVGEDTELVIRLLSSSVKPVHIDAIAVRKHNHNAKRLTSNFLEYSHEKVYETIITRHIGYLRSNRLVLQHIINWSFYVHIISANHRCAIAVLRGARANNASLFSLFLSFMMYFIRSGSEKIFRGERMAPLIKPEILK